MSDPDPDDGLDVDPVIVELQQRLATTQAERDALRRQVARLQTGREIESDYIDELQLVRAERNDSLRERDRLRSELERVGREQDAEQARWQERIESIIIAAGFDPIDASGNESGDSLDYSADQIKAAFYEIEDTLDEIKKTAELVRGSNSADTADALAGKLNKIRALADSLRPGGNDG